MNSKSVVSVDGTFSTVMNLITTQWLESIHRIPISVITIFDLIQILQMFCVR